MGAAGEVRISSTARADYARAAAIVLAGGDHAGRVYELAGDESFTLAELAAMVAKTLGGPMAYQNLTQEAFRSAILAADLLEIVARVQSDTNTGVARLVACFNRLSRPLRGTVTSRHSVPPLAAADAN